jgi:menaquinone-9 beta-reductase
VRGQATAQATAEVIVVGGGPGGAATAWALARAGVDVLILDRAHFPRDKACAEYLSPQASRILDAMGVLEAAESAGGAQLSGMVVRSPAGHAFRGDFAASHGFHGFRDRGLALRRRILDPLLLAAATRDGARLREGVRVRDLVRDRASGRVVGVETDVGVLRAPLVIGADGLRSVVARRLGVAHTAPWPRRLALVTHYVGVEAMGKSGEMHVERDGYLGLADVGRGVTNVALVIPMRSASMLNGDPALYLERWIKRRPHLAPRFAGAWRIAPVHTTGPFAQRARRAWAPGAALVGDAADFFDPFTGEGIYAALRGGELLLPYAFDAVRARTSRVADVALAAYDRCRRHQFTGKWRVERLVAAAVSSSRLMNRAARVLSSRREMADLFVGVAGDFVPPREVLRPSYLLALLGHT